MSTASLTINEMREILGEQFGDLKRDGLLLGEVMPRAVKSLAPEISEDVISQGARTVLGVTAGTVASGALIAYDVHKAPQAEKKWVLGREGASAATTITLGVVSGGFLLPVAAGAAVLGAGYLAEGGYKFAKNEHKISKLEDAHAIAMDNIKPDLTGNSNLRQIADIMDKAVQTGKAARIQSGLAVPQGDFVRDSSGHIDINNAANQRNLRDFITMQKEQTAAAMTQLTELSYLPAGFKHEDKEKALFALEQTKKTLESGALELNTMQINTGSPAVKTSSEMHKIPQDIMNSPDSHAYTYVIKRNTSTVSATDASFPAPSREVLDSYAKTRGPVPEVLFHEVNGRKMPYAADVYNIIDENNPEESRRQAMAATMTSVTGAAPLDTPPRPRKTPAQDISSH
jgi:hypothetical protein